MGIVYTVDPVNFSVALLKVRPRIAPPFERRLLRFRIIIPSSFASPAAARAPPATTDPSPPFSRLTRAPPQFNPISNPIQSSRNAAATSVNQRPTRERDQPGERPADRRPRTRHPRRRGGRRQPARDGSADEEVVRRGSTGVVPRRGGVPARAVRGRLRGLGGRSAACALAAASGGATYKENVGGSARGFGEFSSPASGGDFVSPVSSSRGGLSEDLSRLSTGAGANGGNGAAVYPPVGGRSANASSNSSRDRDDAAAIARMSRVRATLEAARVPVSEERSAKSGGAPGAHVSLVVMGCARLPFPYTADACECANEIVLSRVRELVASVQ